MNEMNDETDLQLQKYLEAKLRPKLGQSELAFRAYLSTAASDVKMPTVRPRWIALSGLAALVALISRLTLSASSAPPAIHASPARLAAIASTAAAPDYQISQSVYGRTVSDGILQIDGIPVQAVQNDWIESTELYDPDSKTRIQTLTPRHQLVLMQLPEY